ncbi:MAG: hypothetical protein ABFS21_12600, partial [Actinomycetota bacterium]
SAMRRAQTIFGSDWEAAVEQGREMTLDEAIELASASIPSPEYTLRSDAGESATAKRPHV